MGGEENGAALRRGSRVVEELNGEWSRLVAEHPDVRIRWPTRPVLHLGSLEEVVRAARLRPDAVLGALLAEAVTGDRLAARVVLQVMLGRVVNMALRDPRREVEDYLGALWCEICRYPLHTRPQRIQANLSLDTLKALCREQRWLARGEVTLWEPGDFLADRVQEVLVRETADREGTAALAARDVLATGRSLGLLNARTERLLHAVYVEGLSGVAAAERHGTTANSVRVQCSRAVRRLAGHAPDLLAAA